MIAHTGLIVSDYKKSKEFYTEVLAPLGYKQTMEYGEAAGYFDGKNTDFWIWRDKKKGMAKLHVAFGAKNKKEVDNFYKIALAAGGKDNGAPGYRKDYWPGYYAAFIHDRDGHNIEVVWFDYSKVKAAKKKRKKSK
jgi:catechol 2,3-dioxygenase-like lactoylglutathione lyase family enzyme